MSYIQIIGHQLFIKIHSKISSDEHYLKFQLIYKLSLRLNVCISVYVFMVYINPCSWGCLMSNKSNLYYFSGVSKHVVLCYNMLKTPILKVLNMENEYLIFFVCV